MHAKVLGDLCQGIITALVGGDHGLFGIARVASIVIERLGVGSALRTRDLLQPLTGGDATVQFLDEGFIAQVDLTAQVLPDFGLILALGDEADETLPGFATTVSELREQKIRLQPRGRRALSDHGAVAAPGVLAGRFHHVGAYGIQDDVAGEFKEVLVLVDQDGGITALEEMPDLAMAAVEGLGINPV